MDEHRITEVWFSAGRVGTGYLVADDLVLTAYHNVPGDDPAHTIQVRPLGRAGWMTAERVWPERVPDVAAKPDADAALLRITDPSWRPPAGSRPVRWGRVVGERVPCLAVGFPDAEARANARDTKEIRGYIESFTGLKSGLITVHVSETAVPGAVRGTSGWSGGSGAALFCGRRLVGILTTDRAATYPGNQLLAVPVTKLTASPGFVAAVTGAGAGLVLEEATAGNSVDPVAPALPPPGEVEAPEGTNNLPDFSSRIFVGRQPQLDLLDRALAENSTAITQTLSGLGGIGKSTLALHYAHSRLHHYRLVWWITADTAEQISTGFAALATRLNGGSAQGRTTAEAAEWAINWLQGHPGWLIVMDNAESPAEIRRVAGQLRHAGRLLITTRYGEGWPATPVELPLLDDRSSVALLVGWTGRTAEDHQAETQALVSELGNFPLALEQAGAYIAQRRITVAEYLAELRRHPEAIMDKSPEGGDHQRTVGRIWSLTLDSIASRDPLAADILHVLAWFAPDAIPRDVLAPLGEDAPLAVTDALALLSAYSMVVLEPDTVSVHRLVQAVARTASGTDPRRSEQALEKHRLRAAELLDRALPDGDPNIPYFDIATWPRWHALLPHVHAHLGLVDPAQDTSVTARLLATTAAFLMCQAQNRQAAAYHQRALAARERLLGADHPDTLASRNGLGHVRLWLDPESSVGLLERNLRARERVLGTDHPDTLVSRHNLADTYLSLGRTEEGIELHRRTLADGERVLGPCDPFTLGSMHHLGTAYQDFGDLVRARELMERALAGERRVLGPEHPNTLNTLSDLAFLHEQSDDHIGAVELYEQALSSRQRALGADHPNTLTTRRNLGLACLAAGLAERAIHVLCTAVAEHERVLGEHLNTLMARNDLAQAYRAAGRPERAMELLGRNLVELQRAFDPADRETLEARTALGLAYSGAVPADERTFQLLEHALEGYESMSGPESLDTARARSDLAFACMSAGDPERAAALYTASLTAYENNLGPDHRSTLATRLSLAEALSSLDPQRSLHLYESVAADRRRILGPDHPDTFLARDHAAYAYVLAGEGAKGIERFRALLADRTRLLGEDDRQVLTSVNNLGLALAETGAATEAIDVLRPALARCERAFGPEDALTLTVRNNLGLAHKNAERPRDAIELFARNLPACERVFGPDHPDTVAGRDNLANAYELADLPGQAAALYVQILADNERAFGTLHTQTLETLARLARTCLLTGQAWEAVQWYGELLHRLERAEDVDRLTVLTNRENLGYALTVAGDAALAVPLLESVLSERVQLQGADHPDVELAGETLRHARERLRAARPSKWKRLVRRRHGRDPRRYGPLL
jgi:tetratricopeptide (TPR) repeat protein